MKKLQVRNSILLLLTATIWGCAFVAQSVGMDYIGPFTFTAIRSLIGSVFLVPCIWILGKFKNTEKQVEKTSVETQKDRKELFVGGILCGIVICVASNLQQFGIMYASVGKSGFLTALYIILVPVLGIFIGRKPGKKICLAVCLAVIGLYLLCMKSGMLKIEFGDILLLLGAFTFSIHIMVVDHFTQKTDGVKLSCIQFLVCGILSAVAMFLFEKLSWTDIFTAWAPILYAGILSCGVAYTLQIVGQKGMNPTIASLIMSLESVVSAIAGWIILGQVLSAGEIAGCIIMFAAIILAQLPEKS